VTDFHQIDGYVADTPYPSNFHQSIQPPWLDAVLALRGIVPPRYGGEPFTYVDLGCGDGIGLILTAASHPQGRFIGVDIMPEHVARGQAMIDQIGLTNITLHCGSFADHMPLADGTAHYVVAHGVLTWVSPEHRIGLFDLAAKWLAPGGVLYLSYNSFPGWAERTPFQALLRAMAQQLPGTSTERFKAACAHLRPLGIISGAVWRYLDEAQGKVSDDYFAHEYLHAHWSPFWSGDVITEMAGRDLAYVAQASAERLRDDLCMTESWRDSIAEFSAIPAREIAADILIGSWFRRDLFLKMPAHVFEEHEAVYFRMRSYWATTPGVEADEPLTCETLAGKIDFDNAAARAILDAVSCDPAQLSAIGDEHGIAAADLLNSVDALWIADRVIPVDAPIANPKIDVTNDALQKAGISVRGRATVFGAITTTEGSAT
jgi:SAM-dependent methyltransferase